ncbi:MAG: hypothetical protein MUF87_08215 [Anaerolineae bacterium]|jgi:hypothetical protein|nr:hypothetical protein [Anaerolineae bacterium]
MNDLAPQISIQDEVLEFLLSSPTPQAIIAFHASDAAQARLRDLLTKNRNGGLTDAEQLELEEAGRVQHFFILLKAKAHQRLKSS